MFPSFGFLFQRCFIRKQSYHKKVVDLKYCLHIQQGDEKNAREAKSALEAAMAATLAEYAPPAAPSPMPGKLWFSIQFRYRNAYEFCSLCGSVRLYIHHHKSSVLWHFLWFCPWSSLIEISLIIQTYLLPRMVELSCPRMLPELKSSSRTNAKLWKHSRSFSGKRMYRQALTGNFNWIFYT